MIRDSDEMGRARGVWSLRKEPFRAHLAGVALAFLVSIAVLSPAMAEAPTTRGPKAAVEESLLPKAGFLPGWEQQGTSERFDPENLYEHIDGEAELYLPYGFQSLTSALFESQGKEKTGLSLEIFRMGSPLDAFGIYSNYRSPERQAAGIGADGYLSETQLVFCQEKYFVRITASGGKPDRNSFVAMGEALARNLPGPPVLPPELGLLDSPDVASRTQRYVAESLLGYRFFPRGLTGEGEYGGKPVKFFVVLAGSAASAAAVLREYTGYLGSSAGLFREESGNGGRTLLVRDPLFRGVVLRQIGANLFGIAKLGTAEEGLTMLEKWLSRLPPGTERGP